MNARPTKAEEITALRSFADTYPTDSYMGAFLRALVPLMEQEIRADIIPSAPYATLEAWRIREQRHALAEIRADIATLRQQEREADAALNTAKASTEKERERLEKIRSTAAADLARALKYVNQEMI